MVIVISAVVIIMSEEFEGSTAVSVKIEVNRI